MQTTNNTINSEDLPRWVRIINSDIFLIFFMPPMEWISIFTIYKTTDPGIGYKLVLIIMLAHVLAIFFTLLTWRFVFHIINDKLKLVEQRGKNTFIRLYCAYKSQKSILRKAAIILAMTQHVILLTSAVTVLSGGMVIRIIEFNT